MVNFFQTLRFTNNILRLSSFNQLQDIVNDLIAESKPVGLQINKSKV